MIKDVSCDSHAISHSFLLHSPCHSVQLFLCRWRADMILPDPEDQQHGKLTPYVAGPTVRLPDRVAGRSSILPDYETSQAQHHTVSLPESSSTSSTASFRKYSLHNTVDSRFWRATLYALAIYIALSVTIGVPLIVTVSSIGGIFSAADSVLHTETCS